jgi:hypothetical protein
MLLALIVHPPERAFVSSARGMSASSPEERPSGNWVWHIAELASIDQYLLAIWLGPRLADWKYLVGGIIS